MSDRNDYANGKAAGLVENRYRGCAIDSRPWAQGWLDGQRERRIAGLPTCPGVLPEDLADDLPVIEP